MSKQKTCEERIDESLSRVADDMKQYMEDPNDEDIVFEGSDSLEMSPLTEYGLSFDYCGPDEEEEEAGDWSGEYFRFQISWGGPSSEIRFYSNGRIEYVFMDWFDGATRDITNEEWASWLGDFLCVDDYHFSEARDNWMSMGRIA